jgi:hypothetical protein
MPKYSALITVDADICLPNADLVNTQGFTCSLTYFAKSDAEAVEGAWKAFESSAIFKSEIEQYVNSILNVEITELVCVESFDDSGTVVGQVVFFGE